VSKENYALRNYFVGKQGQGKFHSDYFLTRNPVEEENLVISTMR